MGSNYSFGIQELSVQQSIGWVNDFAGFRESASKTATFLQNESVLSLMDMIFQRPQPNTLKTGSFFEAQQKNTGRAGAMRLVAITSVKNESDIVEAFVRHTLAASDYLVVLDNGSTDGTLDILRALDALKPGKCDRRAAA
jgi:predicted transcriptional regulator YdeE